MRLGRKIITKDMLDAAQAKGWSVTLTARHYGMHHSSIANACLRLGVELPMHQCSPQRASPRSKLVKETPPPAKTGPVFSCSPAAIARAAQKLRVRD